jgi:hypothetical protein
MGVCMEVGWGDSLLLQATGAAEGSYLLVLYLGGRVSVGASRRWGWVVWAGETASLQLTWCCALSHRIVVP